MKRIDFTKMHGLGNDFVIIDTIKNPLSLEKLAIQALSDRHRGIGFDQLLLIKPSSSANYFCQIFNSDGTEAEQCGNGMRCVARFLHEQHLCEKNSLTLETKGGILQAIIHDYERIEIAMGTPQFNPLIPLFDPPILAVLSLGNPHAILLVASLEKYPIQEIGASLSLHPAFPEGVNVGFMEIINQQHIRLRTYERGSGETFACGSNACAAAAAGIAAQLLVSPVQVELPLGSLKIEWMGLNSKAPVIMTGAATKVFDGTFSI
jgi:diaminopimelate epimerase